MEVKDMYEPCSIKANNHRAWANVILISMILVIIAFICLFVVFQKDKDTLNEHIIYIFAVLIVIFLGVFINIYNFHLKEAARYEFIETAFKRIEIAETIIKSEKYNRADHIEPIKSLTQNAFTFEPSSGSIFKKGKVENPFPGHPTLEVLTALINKLTELIGTLQKGQNE